MIRQLFPGKKYVLPDDPFIEDRICERTSSAYLSGVHAQNAVCHQPFYMFQKTVAIRRFTGTHLTSERINTLDALYQHFSEKLVNALKKIVSPDSLLLQGEAFFSLAGRRSE